MLTRKAVVGINRRQM